MILLCTLGSSWAVVPEAFLLGNGGERYRRVLVLTTAGTQGPVETCREWFSEHYPSVTLTILAVAGLKDLACAEDHHRFEEALLRCYYSLLTSGEPLHVCLAGGFKTMSSAAHQTADLLGCHRLFHVTAAFRERFDSHESLLEGIADQKIRLIDLGPRPGWPTIRELGADSPGIPEESGMIAIGDIPLREKVYARLEVANRLVASERDLATLPFAQIARWTPSQRDWLERPFDPNADAKWIEALPKVELHCHLGGFATHGKLLEKVRVAALGDIPPTRDCAPEGKWPIPNHPIGLESYRNLGDNNGSALLRDPGCLKEHIQLLYQHLQKQHICYAEIRCSPANYAHGERTPWQVLSEILDHFARCQYEVSEAGDIAPRVNLIIIATRQTGGDFRTHIARHLALAATAAEHWMDESSPRVVGVDLAGFESKETRAYYFRQDFTAALRLGLGITIHAGENDDAEGIWSAILDLNTRRLGHALHLQKAPTLLRTVADRHIGIEMCPYANLQIIGFPLDQTAPNDETYPLLAYLEAGVPVTVNTDNIGISSASLTDNFLLLARLCPGIKRIHILQLLRNAIDQSFLTSTEKIALMSDVTIPANFPCISSN